MSERGPPAPPAGMVVTDQQLAEALDSLLRDNNAFTSLNGVVQQLESKLGVNLSHKIDFIRSQIHHFLLLQSQPQNFMPYHHQQQKDHFIVKQLWAYIRKNNLQDPNNKRKIICNDELRLVFETDCTDMFKMNKLLAKHIIALEPTKQTCHGNKKPKVDVETGSRSEDPVPIVIISEALASFFGTDEREMSQAEVLRQMWEYIKVHQLEDPLNSTAILCDAKLQELLGCESISALGIPETLAQRHLFRKS
ncbi:hypothetical protein DH2020_008708 [Rehmannia glutinosa]|uniref:DM2 domain-containing protein n=1 Tax=Rehmannia glutinosa TaxID=99300 RepID=A0ABR0X4R5_REHGL